MTPLAPTFYVGLHQPADAHRFDRACISINRLRGRKKPLGCPMVLVDSGAFTELARHGHYRQPVDAYAAELRRLRRDGVVDFVAAVAQDYMCEAFMLLRTAVADGWGYSTRDFWVESAIDDDGFVVPAHWESEHHLTDAQATARIQLHQDRTIERYDALVEALDGSDVQVMPVLQGYAPEDYVRHLAAYGRRLTRGMWVGVGSVCKRNGDPEAIVEVACAIKAARPELRLHGFGVKRTALLHPGVRSMFATADSMAWSFAARKQGRNANDWREAAAFSDLVSATAGLAHRPWQMPLPL